MDPNCSRCRILCKTLYGPSIKLKNNLMRDIHYFFVTICVKKQIFVKKNNVKKYNI